MNSTAAGSSNAAKHGLRIADVLSGRENNLNVIRMIAALLVVVSHAFPISLGAGAREPLVAETGESLGHFAVVIFFVISGLLIARSFDRRSSMAGFVTARVLRLFPALLVVLVLTVLGGAIITRLPLTEYVLNKATWTYVPANLSLAFLQYPLPGVFENNLYGSAINGSLWTLIYEVVCYGLVAVIGALGMLKRPWTMLAVVLMASMLADANLFNSISELGVPKSVALRTELLSALAFPFLLGTCAYVWRDQLWLSGWIALLLCLPIPLLSETPLLKPLIIVALSYGTLWLAFVPKGWTLAYNRVGDYSYGVYIYAFPVQQALVWWLPGIRPAFQITLALPIVVLLGFLSWNLVEKRALAAAPILTARIRGFRGQADSTRNTASVSSSMKG